MSSVSERYGEALLQSEFNQREYCEAYGIPLKASALACGVQKPRSWLTGAGPHHPTRARGSASEVQRSRQTADTSGGDAAGCKIRKSTFNVASAVQFSCFYCHPH